LICFVRSGFVVGGWVFHHSIVPSLFSFLLSISCPKAGASTL
jgi:hypothetical protein